MGRLSKKEFVDIMGQLKSNMEKEDEINNLFNGEYCNPLTSIVVDLLTKGMNLDEEYETIYWWMYDVEFGKEGKDCVEIEGKSISLNTAEDLYDFLIKYETKDKPEKEPSIFIDNLSLKALGLLFYLLNIPKDTKLSERRLASDFPDGLTSVQTALRELENKGYLKREQARCKTGGFGNAIYTVKGNPNE